MTIEYVTFLPDEQGIAEVPLLSDDLGGVLETLYRAVEQQRVRRQPLRPGLHMLAAPVNCSGAGCTVDVSPLGTAVAFMVQTRQQVRLPEDGFIMPLGCDERGSIHLTSILHYVETSSIVLDAIPVSEPR